MNFFNIFCLSFFSLLFISNPLFASKKNIKDFNKFVVHFAEKKLDKKINKKLIQEFLKKTKFVKRVIELDRSQPEFKLSLDEYLQKVITKSRIKKAILKYKNNKTTLDKIGDHFNVQPRFIVALWGIETDFGRVTGSFPVISSLTTLVYDGRRGAYFEKELLNALKIIENGHITMDNMKGSWAGAMGQCQFMPSSFIRYARDWNKDGKIDIWHTKMDVFASASNYLKEVKWNNKKTWGRKVYFKNNQKIKNNKDWYSLKKWKSLGILNVDETELPNLDLKARLIIPENYQNYGYLVYSNFESLLKWNRSNYFAIAVGTLSDYLIINKNKVLKK